MHVLFQVTDHLAILVATILGCLFWLAVIVCIALFLVSNRIIDGILGEADQDQGDPNE